MDTLRVDSIDLEITTRCNLCCSYCYIGLADRKDVGDMTDATMELVFDLIDRHGAPRAYQTETRHGGKRKVDATQVSFYGGEPLLVFDRVKYFVERARERGMSLRFSVLSNGTIGTPEMVAWLNDNHIWTQRSIDGCPEAQEKYRPCSIEAYNRTSEVFRDYGHSRRMTVQPEFAKDLMKSLRYFESQGFMCGVSPMPNFYTDWSHQQIEDFRRSLWDLAKHYLKRWKEGRPFYVYYLSREMASRFIGGRSQFGCGGGSGLHCVSREGWLYMCHRFASESHDSQFCYGHLTDILAGAAKGYGDAVRQRIATTRRGKQDDWNLECKTCIAQQACEKACMHTNLKTTGTLHQPPKLFCVLRQEAAKIVAWLDRELRTVDPDWWTRGNSLKSVRDYLAKKRCPKCGARKKVSNVKTAVCDSPTRSAREQQAGGLSI